MEVKANYYLGIDVGGTDIKYAVVSDKDCIIHSNSLPTDKTSEKSFLIQIENIVNDVRKDYLISKIGMGIPGNVSTKKGIVEYSANLPFRNTNVAGYLSERLGMNVKIAKDAISGAVTGATSAVTSNIGKGFTTIKDGTWSGTNNSNATIEGGTWSGDNTDVVIFNGGTWSGNNTASGKVTVNKEGWIVSN